MFTNSSLCLLILKRQPRILIKSLNQLRPFVHDFNFKLTAFTELTNKYRLTVLECRNIYLEVITIVCFSLIPDPLNQSENILIKPPEKIKQGSL